MVQGLGLLLPCEMDEEDPSVVGGLLDCRRDPERGEPGESEGPSLFSLSAVILSASALLAWLNHRVLRLPRTIGLMALSLAASLLVLFVGMLVPEAAFVRWLVEGVAAVDFDETVMHGMLGFLLFAGALHVDLADLKKQTRVVAVLATLGVLISTAVVGALAYLVTSTLGLSVSLLHCLVFGALISPTDPIAVMGILKTLGAPKTLETKIAGESLFNDGVGVVVFLALFGVAFGGSRGAEGGLAGVGLLFAQEALGGALLGLVLGFVAFAMLRAVDQYQVEILVSLALVAGGYELALALHVSGPIAMVVAGLLIGNQGRAFAMSATTRQHLDTFWELIDEILNAVLFVLIGLEVLVLAFTGRFLVAGLLLIPAVLLGRFVAVGTAVSVLRRFREFTPHVVKIMTWSGLRGGISVALALSIPKAIEGEMVASRDLLVAVTYVVVCFSILVQGLTVGPLVWRLLRSPGRGPS